MILLSLVTLTTVAFAGGLCPDSPADWQKKLNGLSVHGLQQLRSLRQDGEDLQSQIDTCRSQAKLPAAVDPCTKNLRDWLVEMKHVDQGLTELPAYIAKTDPEMGKLPAFFTGNHLFPNWRKDFDACQAGQRSSHDCASIKGAQIIDYYHTGIGATAAFKASLIYLPGTNYDRFMAFGSSDMLQGTFGVDFLTVQKKDPATSKDLPEKLLLPSTAKGATETLHPAVDMSGGRSCVGCHPNGPRKIVPIPGSVSNADLPKMEAINKVIASYGRVGVPGLNLEHVGPSLGSGQTCTGCHNSGSREENMKFPNRTSLNFLTAQSQVFGKMSAKNFFAMPTTMTSQPGLKTYFEALAKVNELSAEDRLAIAESARPGFRKGVTGLEGGGVALDYIDPLANAGEKVLNSLDFLGGSDIAWQVSLLNMLEKRQKITHAQRDEAEASLRKYDKLMRQQFKEMYSDSKTELATWLHGGSDHCITDTAQSLTDPARSQITH